MEAITNVDDRIVITVPEASHRLGIGITKGWRMAGTGTMPGLVRIGRSVRVSVVALEAWVAEQVAESEQRRRSA
jgi:excisionase family DNA binding protein